MGVLAANAVARARQSIVTKQTPQGMCLNWVWRMFGAQNSTGYASGTLTTALSAWNSSRQKHTDRNIPIGAPVYFGVSPTRTDRNKYAGDVMIHIGGGILAGTDVNGANTGFITIEARSKQIQRPYLGWCGDFGGRPIDFGVTAVATADGPVIIPKLKKPKGDSMIFLQGGRNRGACLVGAGYYHSLSPEEASQASLVADKVVSVGDNDRAYDLIRQMCATPHPLP